MLVLLGAAHIFATMSYTTLIDRFLCASTFQETDRVGPIETSARTQPIAGTEEAAVLERSSLDNKQRQTLAVVYSLELVRVTVLEKERT